ncbi:MAG: TetR-like C-terminal domain-containing protein [Mobilitalea sp.]
MEKKVDGRVRYTKMVIRNSFVSLLKQKPISKITIKEICEGADINRATFYAHYTDQYDLLKQIENEILNDINRYLNNFDYNNKASTHIEMIDNIIIYIAENAELFDLFLNSKGDIEFQQELINIIGNQHFSTLPGTKILSKEDMDFVFCFLASGAVGVIKKWLESGMKKSTKDLAELILKTAMFGQQSFG